MFYWIPFGSLAAPFGLPLALNIHQGLIHIGKEDKNETLQTMIIHMALDFALRHNLPCILTLDAYFPCASIYYGNPQAVLSVLFLPLPAATLLF
jgi:hypothetical protein